ncbi:MAG: tetratricopeptide repeat protein [Desulfovibrionaceae bacterium]|nr:tetratricopeptide repeat protein [Desulfovibrionaceae bacterium]
MSVWQRFKKYLRSEDKRLVAYPSGVTPREKDTLTAIRELSRAVMSSPDTVEIYMALGNLYRARGDVERAVQIRESLLIRQELSTHFKGQIQFELGQDYRRAGLLDRALAAYLEAQRLGVAARLIHNELAALYAGAGEWEKACEFFSAMGHKVAEAHFMVRQGMDILSKDRRDVKKAVKIFEKAIKVYPASIEAWYALLAEQMRAEKWPSAAKTLGMALERIPAEKSFMVFEEILHYKAENLEQGQEQDAFHSRMTDTFVPVLSRRPPELFPNFYGAVLLKRSGCLEEAEQWLDKALVMQPDFWHGRLLHLTLLRQKEAPPPLLEADLDFFLAQSGQVKYFVCSACGLNREQLFYCCQRCNSWHSAIYKFTIYD